MKRGTELLARSAKGLDNASLHSYK